MGAYNKRTEINSKDEIGLLSDSFDKMAEAVEEKIKSLEQEICTREDFVSNFSHELKTPMTSMMGYADMLRSYGIQRRFICKPFAFSYDLVSLSKPMAELVDFNYENMKSINYLQMLELYESVEKRHKSPESFFFIPGSVKEMFFDVEVMEYYNVDSGMVDIDSDDFIEFLNRTKQIPTDYSPDNVGGWQMMRVFDGNDDFLKSDFMFTKFQSNAIDLYNMMIEYENMIPLPIVLHSLAGNAPFETYSATYAIPKNSKSKELAWEFLKYCISEKEVSDFENEEDKLRYFMMYEGFIPINIQNFYEYFRFNFENEIDRIKTHEIAVNWKFKNPNELIDETLDTIHHFNLIMNKYTSQFELFNLVKTDLETFYYFDLATAKETASIIHNKVFSYIME